MRTAVEIAHPSLLLTSRKGMIHLCPPLFPFNRETLELSPLSKPSAGGAPSKLCRCSCSERQAGVAQADKRTTSVDMADATKKISLR
jgi:hypothetical protein